MGGCATKPMFVVIGGGRKTKNPTIHDVNNKSVVEVTTNAADMVVFYDKKAVEEEPLVDLSPPKPEAGPLSKANVAEESNRLADDLRELKVDALEADYSKEAYAKESDEVITERNAIITAMETEENSASVKKDTEVEDSKSANDETENDSTPAAKEAEDVAGKIAEKVEEVVDFVKEAAADHKKKTEEEKKTAAAETNISS